MSDAPPLVVANHKANMDYSDFDIWLHDIGPVGGDYPATLIVCPSTPFLALTWLAIQSNSWKMKLGSQDVSQFDQGAYTGEVAASQLDGICTYAIIGHSERRNNFQETDKTLENKVQKARRFVYNLAYNTICQCVEPITKISGLKNNNGITCHSHCFF